MKRAVALGVCLALATPPAASAQSGGSYDEAVAARQAGNPERAAALLRPIVAANPGHADAQVQLGLALLALDRLDEAEQAFRQALAVAPDYADARVGLARIAQRRGDNAAARAELDRVDQAYPDAAALRAQLDGKPAGSGWRLDLDGSYSALEGGQPDWRELSVQLGRQMTADRAVAGRVEVARRFDNTDVYGEVRLDQRLSDRVTAYASFGGAPGADFLPEWQVSLGGSARITDGGSATVLTLDTRHAQYAAGDVQTVSPGIEQYLADGRVWLTGRWINIFDEDGEHQSGYLLRADALATDRLRLFAGYSDAPDTSEGVVVDTRTVFGGAALDLDARTSLRLSLAHEDRETGFDRTQLSLGVGFGF